MKKLFSQKQETHYDTFIGKQYAVGDLTLVVEVVIAEGGFSYVFLVRDVAKNKVYALKRMLVNSQSDLENCKREINIMKQFHRHPSIVPFKGHYTRHIGNGIYEVLMLMAHCPNGTVVDKMNDQIKSGFAEDTVIRIFGGIVDAVALMHQHDICHRDLKVENILVGPNKEYVLCDFGSVIKGSLDPEVDGHTFVEENINRFTTLQYRAPEMIDMYSGFTIGTPADCWALGVLLYKLCFFTTPFEDNTLAIARAKFTIPADSKYSDKLHSIIKGTLQRNPKDRLTAGQITDRLKGDRNNTSSSEKQTNFQKLERVPKIEKGPKLHKASKVSKIETSSASQQKFSSATTITHQPRNVAEIPRQTSEDKIIKSRQRPRGTQKQTVEQGNMIIVPPVPGPKSNSPTSTPNKHSPTPEIRTQTSHAPTQASLIMADAGFSDQVSQPEDPWNVQRVGLVTGSISPQSPKMIRHRQRPLPNSDSTSQLVLLPPPPSSPSHRRRGHSRAKSDTTFLKTSNSPTKKSFMSDMSIPQNNMKQQALAARGQNSLSSSMGRLQAGSEMLSGGVTSPMCCSEDSIEAAGWSNIPFTPPVEDEFLKLSLRENALSNTGLDKTEKPPSLQSGTVEKVKKPSAKVSRAQIRRLEQDRDPLSSELRLLLSNPGNSTPASYEDLLKSPALLRATSEDTQHTFSVGTDTRTSGIINHGLSLSSLASVDNAAFKKKKKKLSLFGKKKYRSSEQVNKMGAVVSNPLHDNFSS